MPWVGLEALADIRDLSSEDVLARLAGSEIFQSYEIGQCADAPFLNEMIQLFDISVLPREFAEQWNSWVRPPFPQALLALEQLKETYTVACLSNTNDLHWIHLNKMFRTDEVFDFNFASHKIHAAKPDPRSYKIPLEIMQVPAETVTFFDDTFVNVEAARAIGMTAHHVDRKKGVLPLLKTLGYIS